MTKPRASSGAKPRASAETKPRASAETKPRASADTKPRASAETKPPSIGGPILRRRGVLLTREDVPPPRNSHADVTSVFNPGAIHWRGHDRLLLRVQGRSRETYLYPATASEPGHFEVASQPIWIRGLREAARSLEIYHVYDPRLTAIDGHVYAVLAVDTNRGCRLLTAQTEDFENWSLVALDGDGDRRNGVLFPTKIRGEYLRLERPNQEQADGQPRSGSEVVLASSSDLLSWKQVSPVFQGRPHYWDELVGAGPPPIRTDQGWLLFYHGVATHFVGAHIYQAGAVLLDLEDPSRVLGRTRENILEPREVYEMVGQVPNVVFPSGAIVRGDEVDVYYGAADTCVAWATGSIERVLSTLEDPSALSTGSDRR